MVVIKISKSYHIMLKYNFCESESRPDELYSSKRLEVFALKCTQGSKVQVKVIYT